MHELAVMENVLEIVLEHAESHGAQKVRKINLTLGALSDIVPRWAQLYFTLIARDTIADQALLTMESVPALIKCRRCGTATEVGRDRLLDNCPSCHGPDVVLIAGREFRISTIEIE